MGDTRVVKRYANRKLYDTQRSRYVTLEQIADMIRAGEDVKIVDNNSKDDLTAITLAQIIFEEEKKSSFLPLSALRNIIQSGADRVEHLLIGHVLTARRNARSMFLLMAGCGALALLIPSDAGFTWTVKGIIVVVFAASGAAFLLPALRAPENHPVLAQVRHR